MDVPEDLETLPNASFPAYCRQHIPVGGLLYKPPLEYSAHNNPQASTASPPGLLHLSPGSPAQRPQIVILKKKHHVANSGTMHPGLAITPNRTQMC